jgi:hypothetical protein
LVTPLSLLKDELDLFTLLPLWPLEKLLLDVSSLRLLVNMMAECPECRYFCTSVKLFVAVGMKARFWVGEKS